MRYISRIICLLVLVTAVMLSACHSEAAADNESNTTMTENQNTQDACILSSPKTKGSISVEEALVSRRSRRSFNDTALSIDQLSQILWAAYGISDGNNLRTSPSAGALYPLEIYAVIGNITGIEPGVYKYISREHKIIRKISTDVRDELSAAALNQSMIKDAPLTVVYTAVFDSVIERYGDRGRERFVFIETGHSAQNIYLQAEALGLGTCAVGAFTDDKVSELLELPTDEIPLYIMPVGHHK